MSSKTAVVVGASAGVGRALAEKLAETGWNLVLSARNARDLEAVAADLRLRFGAHCRAAPVDLGRADFDAEDFRRNCLAEPGTVDALFVVAGHAELEDGELASDESLRRIVLVNYLNSIRLLQAFAQTFGLRGRGLLVGFSSVAASAPRKRNIVYGSAKAGLEAYLKALRHHFAGTSVLVQGYSLGYVDTAQTYGKKLALPRAAPRDVAEHVVARLQSDRGMTYFPAWWAIVVWTLRRLPWFVYKRLNF